MVLPAMDKNYLFLDLSSKASGYAVSSQQGQLITSGVIKSSSTDALKRIQIMRDNVQQLVKDYNITHIVAEDPYQNGVQSRTNQILMWVQGTVIIAAYEANKSITYEFILPNSWRSKIGIHTGRGIKREELKQADIQYVFNKYGLNVGDDEADAICIMDSYFTTQKKVVLDWSK